MSYFTRKNTVIIASEAAPGLGLREAWKFRYLLYWLGWRDIQVRYAEAAIGMLWALLQPLAMVGVLSFALGFLARVPSDGKPYSVFVICGIAIWTIFTAVVSGVSNSLAVNAPLLSKIYCSRLAVVLSSTAAPMIDALSMFVAMIFLTLLLTHSISVFAPLGLLFMVWALVVGVGVGLWFSALSIHHRDVLIALPLVLQVGMFASPIIYPPSLVPEKFRIFLEINPFFAIIQGMRWAIYGGDAPEASTCAFAAVMTLGLLISALYYFNEVQRSFADRM